MNKIVETIVTPVMGDYDVIVAGGGVAGICAAVSASRNGAKRILIIEKTVQFGGLATIGLINWYEPLCDGNGKRVMHGMAEELLYLAIKYGPDSLPPEWRVNPYSALTKKRFSTYFSNTLLVLALDKLVKEHDINVLFDTQVVKPLMNGETCRGIIVENKTGRGLYNAKIVVDTTGDADLLARAGVPCICGSNYLSYIAYLADGHTLKKSSCLNNIMHISRWLKMGSDLWGKGHPENYPMLSGVTAEEVTKYVLDGRSLLFEYIKDDNRHKRDITMLPNMAQLRTTRRIEGEYTLTELDEGKSFADSIAICGDFANPGKKYELPYRLLYNSNCNNILTAGRSISSSGWAWDVTRVIPVAAATGQAAGAAAAICAMRNVAVKDVIIDELQQQLVKSGVHIHF